MNRAMIRKDRELEEKDAINVLENGLYGVLSTVGKDNMPYGVPISYIYLDNCIYMHCSKNEGHKLENIKYNDNVSFNVVTDIETIASAFSTKYMSVVIFGKIAIVEEAEEKEKAMKGILYKYSDKYIESGLKYLKDSFDKVNVLKIEVSEISGKGRK